MVEERERKVVPPRQLDTDYPLIDVDPHFNRVLRYARPSDYAVAAGVSALSPTMMWVMERVAPSYVGKGGFAPVMRLSFVVSITGGFLMLYKRSQNRFYGFSENRREIAMDMREMVNKVKNGEPLYGKSSLNEYMQGVAARNSRHSVLSMFNRMEAPYSNGDSMAWTLQNIINKLKENWNKNEYKHTWPTSVTIFDQAGHGCLNTKVRSVHVNFGFLYGFSAIAKTLLKNVKFHDIVNELASRAH